MWLLRWLVGARLDVGVGARAAAARAGAPGTALVMGTVVAGRAGRAGRSRAAGGAGRPAVRRRTGRGRRRGRARGRMGRDASAEDEGTRERNCCRSLGD